MLQLGIHCVITDIIVSLCKDISSERKRKWPEGVGPICDREEWVAKGRPNPMGTISAGLLPEYHPIAILRVLNEFFQDGNMQDRLKRSITRRRREITADYDPRQHSIDLHTMTSMELFNGVGCSVHGGLRNIIGPAIPYVNSWDGSEWAHSSLEYISNYYKAWDCENDFVHPMNKTIGFYTQEYIDRNRESLWSTPEHNMTMYSDIDFRNDNHPHMLDRDGTIRCFTKNEKKKIITRFLRELCEKYMVNEPSPFVRATWYEVSEFIKFYYDIWQLIDHPDGDDEDWMSKGITTVPLSSYRYNSSMYSISGVWNMEEGGKWTDNFERIMKLGTVHEDDWYNSIWKKKFITYCQRIFEDDEVFIYSVIETVDESDEESDEESELDISEQLQEMTEITTEIENTPKEKVKHLMDLIFVKKNDMKEGVFLEICNELKEIYNVL